ncbi:MAG: RNA-binding S4 domain-containing protein [Gemmatimonadales bacterium]
MVSEAGVRLDKWLWAARFYKTRALAAAAIDGGKVQVEGERARRSRALAPGDNLRIRQGAFEYRIQVRALSRRRGPASEAAELYEELPESRAAREALALQMRQLDGPLRQMKGRPAKKDRRALRELKGKGDR